MLIFAVIPIINHSKVFLVATISLNTFAHLALHTTVKHNSERKDRDRVVELCANVRTEPVKEVILATVVAHY